MAERHRDVVEPLLVGLADVHPAQPVRLDDGSTRSFLVDGDEVVVSATAPGPDGAVVGLDEARGTVLPAP